MSVTSKVEIADDTDNHYWCKESPNIQRAWSPSSLDTLQTCPRKYFYSYVLGVKTDWNRPAPSFGRFFHSGCEIYRKTLAETGDPDLAIDNAVNYGLEIGWEWEGDEARNNFTLVRALIWYFDKWKNDSLEILTLASGRPAIEVSFKIALPLTNPDGEPYLLTGFMDNLVSFMGTPMVHEMKTTKTTIGENYYAQYTMSNQVSAYCLAGSVHFGSAISDLLIDATQIGVTMSEFGRSPQRRTAEQLEEWLDNTLVSLQDAERFAEKNHWPMNLSACNHYGGCPFRAHCSQLPSMRDDTEFEIDRREYIDRRGD